MIRVVSKQETEYQGSWNEFVKWISPQKELQFDIETNVTSFECTRQVKTLQFGDIQDTVQYVLEYAVLTPEQLEVIKTILESWEIVKYIHSASFEYVTMRFHGMQVHNVFCTMVAEQVIMGGVPMKDLKLTDLTEKYLGFRMDKTLQTSFGDGILTKEKVEYAADDVKPLHRIAECQRKIIAEHKLENVIWLEMRSLLAFSECTFHGVGLNLQKWQENITLAEPVVKASKEALDNWIRQDSRLLAKAIELNYYKTSDQVNFNLNSPAQKLKLLQWVFPEIQGSSSTIIKAFVRDNNNTLSVESIYMLLSLADKNYTPFSNYLIENYREQLIENNLLFPEGTIEINWNSQTQVLPLARAVEPKLKDLSEESLADTTHELFDSLSNYKDSLKLVSSYGQAFIDKHVQPDGRVRTHYNQVVSTGRSSSSKPKHIGQRPCERRNKYRVNSGKAVMPILSQDNRG